MKELKFAPSLIDLRLTQETGPIEYWCGKRVASQLPPAKLELTIELDSESAAAVLQQHVKNRIDGNYYAPGLASILDVLVAHLGKE